MLVVKEAPIIPAEANNPPTSITGRHPNLLTMILDSGPVQEKMKSYSLDSQRLALTVRSAACQVACPFCLSVFLTWAIKHGKHDRGNPCCVTVATAKVSHQFFKVHTNGFRKSVGETSDNEATKQHNPAPASVWRIHSVSLSHTASHVLSSNSCRKGIHL